MRNAVSNGNSAMDPNQKFQVLIQSPVGTAAIPVVVGAAPPLTRLIASFPAPVEEFHIPYRPSRKSRRPTRSPLPQSRLPGPAVPTAF